MRRYVLLAAAVAPILAVTAAVTVPGCGEEFENICAFIQDPNSCYATFYNDVKDRCGASGAKEQRRGRFASRETLDVCFLDKGGQVVFDPPLDIAAFPPKSVAFKILDAQAEECGSFTYSGEFTYSVTIDPCRAAQADTGASGGGGTGGGGAGGGTGGVSPDGGTDAAIPLCDYGSTGDSDGSGGSIGGGGGSGDKAVAVRGGTVTVTTPEGRATLDVACNNDSSHHFNRIDAEKKCVEYAQLLPKAVLKASLGNQPPPDAGQDLFDEYEGYISFSVHYPPNLAAPDGGDADAGIADAGIADAGIADAGDAGAVPQPEVVEYFYCEFPPPPPLCFNGVKDGPETDIDCGGTLCAGRCSDGQSCINDRDCGDGLACGVVSGFRKCKAVEVDAGANGAGDTGDAGGQ
ncbi:hypothetical protein WME94_33360 [Sorangium sp. So ce429]